jgi:acyl carrier protein
MGSEERMDRNDLVELFRKLAAEIEPRDFSHVTESDGITSLGIDSLGLSELVGAMEQELEIHVTEEQLAGVRTVEQLLDLMERQLEAKSAATRTASRS